MLVQVDVCAQGLLGFDLILGFAAFAHQRHQKHQFCSLGHSCVDGKLLPQGFGDWHSSTHKESFTHPLGKDTPPPPPLANKHSADCNMTASSSAYKLLNSSSFSFYCISLKAVFAKYLLANRLVAQRRTRRVELRGWIFNFWLFLLVIFETFVLDDALGHRYTSSSFCSLMSSWNITLFESYSFAVCSFHL